MRVIVVYHSEYRGLHSGIHRKPPARLGAPSLCSHICYWYPSALPGDDPTDLPDTSRARRDRWIGYIDDLLENIVSTVSNIDNQFIPNIKSRSPNHYGRGNLYLFNSVLSSSAHGFARRPIFSSPHIAKNGLHYDQNIDLTQDRMPSNLQSFSIDFVWHGLLAKLQFVLHSEYLSVTRTIELSHLGVAAEIGFPRSAPQTYLYEDIKKSFDTINDVCNLRFDRIERWCNAGNRPTELWSEETSLDRERLAEVHSFLFDGIWTKFDTEILARSYEMSGDQTFLQTRIGAVFYDARGVVLHCPHGENNRFCSAPFHVEDRSPLALAVALNDKFTNQSAVNHVDAVLPFLSTRNFNDDSRVEFTVSRFLGNRVIYMSSLAAEQVDDLSTRQPVKFLILSRSYHRWQLGRFVDRLFSLGELRVAALMNFSILHDAGDALRDLNIEVQEQLRRSPPAAAPAAVLNDSKSLSEKLFHLWGRTIELGARCDGGIAYRIERSRYYVQQFREVLSDFRINIVEGFQKYDVFIRRRVFSAFDYVNRLGVRLERHKIDLNVLGQRIQIEQHLSINQRIASINERIEGIESEATNLQSRALQIAIFGELFAFFPLVYYTGYVANKLIMEVLLGVAHMGWIELDAAKYMISESSQWSYLGASLAWVGVIVASFLHHRKIKRSPESLRNSN